MFGRQSFDAFDSLCTPYVITGERCQAWGSELFTIMAAGCVAFVEALFVPFTWFYFWKRDAASRIFSINKFLIRCTYSLGPTT